MSGEAQGWKAAAVNNAVKPKPVWKVTAFLGSLNGPKLTRHPEGQDLLEALEHFAADLRKEAIFEFPALEKGARFELNLKIEGRGA